MNGTDAFLSSLPLRAFASSSIAKLAIITTGLTRSRAAPTFRYAIGDCTKMKRNMISPLITLLKRMLYRSGLKKKQLGFGMRGSNSIAIPYSKPLCWREVSSSCSSQSSDSWETLDCVQRPLTSAEMSRPTLLLTPSSVMHSDFSLTKKSISLGELRLLGYFNPSKGKTLHAISRRTSGWLIQTRFTPLGKLKG